MSGSSNYSQQQLSSQTQGGGGQMPGEGGILRILELDTGVFKYASLWQRPAKPVFPHPRAQYCSYARNKERRHPSIVAYSDADLGTSDANTGRSLTDAANLR